MRKKLPIYQFSAGRRIFHIPAETQKIAEKKADAWHKKNAPNTVLAYDFRVD